MAESTHVDRAWREGIITALAWGGFFVILGVVFGLTPGIFDAIGRFFDDFTTVSFPAINGNILLPAPAHPAAHLEFYRAVITFMISIAVLQVAILALRFWAHSAIRRIAETVGNLIWWAGAAVSAYVYLLAGTQSGWFTFWPLLIILAGISLIVQGVIRLAFRRR